MIGRTTRRVLLTCLALAGPMAGCSPRQAKDEPATPAVEAPPAAALQPPGKPVVAQVVEVAPPPPATVTPVAQDEADAAQIADDAAAVGMTTQEDPETPGGASDP